jgi:hypothetical protein
MTLLNKQNVTDKKITKEAFYMHTKSFNLSTNERRPILQVPQTDT